MLWKIFSFTDIDCHVPALIYKGQALYEESHFGEDYETNDKETIEAATNKMKM